MNIADFFKNLLNSLLDGSFERMRVINSMNKSFKEFFLSGEFNRMCHVSISQGNSEFAHEMSSFWMRSGFKIAIKNDANLAMEEIMSISEYILANKSFVRQLMAMGFDTLVIQGENNKIGRMFSLKAYANLDGYFLK